VKNLDWQRVGPRGPSRESGLYLLARRAQCSDLAAKEDVSKRKKSERETRKHTRKPASTCAGGRGIDRVGRTYPDPYPGRVYLAGYRVSGTRANPYTCYTSISLRLMFVIEAPEAPPTFTSLAVDLYESVSRDDNCTHRNTHCALLKISFIIM
jgi:hypothetical protein